VIRIASVSGLATVQDAGRRGHMHEGVPVGGALVPELLARANAAAGNPPDAAAIELMGRLTIEALAGCVVATDDGRREELAVGSRWAATCARDRARYLAVRGGFDVPVVLGGRGTLLVAGIGGHEGRALRSGDVLRAGSAPLRPPGILPAGPDRSAPIAVFPGPDLHRFEAGVFDLLLGGSFLVDPASDRPGIRLSGPPLLPRAGADGGGDGNGNGNAGVSAPMVRGAVQVPPSGQPVLLGPDHPTTGGYPVVALVARACFGAVGALVPGDTVRFVSGR
jgi:biotin-dependent carboxylase-like uncharacterized protein